MPFTFEGESQGVKYTVDNTDAESLSPKQVKYFMDYVKNGYK